MTTYRNKSLQANQGRAVTLDINGGDTVEFTVSEFNLNNSSNVAQFSWRGSTTEGLLQLSDDALLQFGGTAGSHDGEWSLFNDSNDGDSLRLQHSDNPNRDILNFDTDLLAIGNGTDMIPVAIYGLQTAVLDAGGLTLDGDVTVNGDLTVNGTTTTINTQTLDVTDNVIELASGNIGDDLDIGWIGDRGAGSIGGENNVAVFWDHTNDTFAMATTDSDASTPDLDINVIAYAPLHLANIDASVDAQNTFAGPVAAQNGLAVTNDALTANTGGTFSGSTDWNFTGGDVHLNDNINLELGNDKDLTIVHNGASASFVNTTGSWEFDNQETTGGTRTYFSLGTDDSDTAFQVRDNTGNGLLTVFGSGQVDILTALNLPFQDSVAAEGNIRYHSGDKNVEYYDGNDWVTLADATGSVTLQAAYDAGNTIELSDVEGDFAITIDDGASIGTGAIADVTMTSKQSGGNYFKTDGTNTKTVLGDKTNDIETDINGGLTVDKLLSGTGDTVIYVSNIEMSEDKQTLLGVAGSSEGLTSAMIRGVFSDISDNGGDDASSFIINFYADDPSDAGSATKIAYYSHGTNHTYTLASQEAMILGTLANNGNITLDPHGTGTIILDADTVLNTGNLSAPEPLTISTTQDNDDITLSPNGTGSVIIDDVHMLWTTDDSYDIGADTDNRPRGVYVGSGVEVGNEARLLSTRLTMTTDLSAIALGTDAHVAVDLPDFTTAVRDTLTPSTGWTIYNSTTGSIEFWDGAQWVSVAETTLQTAYEGGNTITMSGAEGDLEFIVDETSSLGDAYADFIVRGEGASIGAANDYLRTDAANTRLLLGEGGAVDVYMQDSNLLFLNDGTGTIGADGANRPSHIYAETDVKVGDSITISSNAITSSAGQTMTIAGGGGVSDTILLSPGAATVRLGDGDELAFGDSDDARMDWNGSALVTNLANNGIWQANISGNGYFEISGSSNGNFTFEESGKTSILLDAFVDASAFNIAITGGLDIFNVDTSGGTPVTFGNSGSTWNFGFLGGGETQFSGPIRLTEASDPTNVANNGFVYTKDDSGDTELYYMDEDANVIQLTADGFLNADAVGMPALSGATYTTLVDTSDNFLSAGRVTGGSITDAGGEKFDVAAGTGYIRISNSPLHIADLLSFDWSASADNVTSSGDIKEVGVEYNSGTPQVVVHDAPYSWNNHDEFPLGTVINEGGTLHIQNDPMFVADGLSHTQRRFWETEPLDRDDRTGGLILGETGTRNVTLSAGALWDRLNRYAISAIDTDPSVGADTFDRYYRDGVGGFTRQADQSTWDNTQYDDGDGTLATMTDNYYAVQWFWLEPDGELVSMYGTAEYSSLAEAENEGVPASIPDRIHYHARLVGRIIFQKSAGTASEVQSVFTETFSAAGAADHGNLAGLGDDDHTQYILVNGSRAFTGGVEINSLDGLTTDQEVLNLGTDGSASVGIPVFTTGERDALTPDEGWAVFNTTTKALNVYNGTAWETAAASLQEAYEAGNTITLDDTHGDLEFILDETGTANDFIVRGEGASIGASNSYLRTDAENTRLILGDEADSIDVYVGGDILPMTAGTPNLGSVSAEWGNIYMGDSKFLYFGSDQDASIRHNGANLILRNDTGPFSIQLPDNVNESFKVRDSTKTYFQVTTLDGSEALTLSNTTDWAPTTIYGQTSVGSLTDKVPVGSGEIGLVVAAESNTATISPFAASLYALFDGDSGTTITDNGNVAAFSPHITTSSDPDDTATYIAIVPQVTNNGGGSIGGGGDTVGLMFTSNNAFDYAIAVQSGAGLVDLSPAAGVGGTPGGVQFTALDDVAEAITFITDAGNTSATIKLNNRSGTASDAIHLHAQAGWVLVQGESGIDLQPGENEITYAKESFRLPLASEGSTATVNGLIRYNAGTGIQYYDGGWITLAAATGTVTLQSAYNAGQTIQLDESLGDMVITTSASSVGGDFADFQVTGAPGDYLQTDEANDRLLLGDAAVNVYMQGNDLLWTADGGGDIGADGANRPDHIYAKTDVKIGDSSVIISTDTLQASAGLTLAANGGSNSNIAFDTAGKITLTPFAGEDVEFSLGVGDSVVSIPKTLSAGNSNHALAVDVTVADDNTQSAAIFQATGPVGGYSKSSYVAAIRAQTVSGINDTDGDYFGLYLNHSDNSSIGSGVTNSAIHVTGYTTAMTSAGVDLKFAPDTGQNVDVTVGLNLPGTGGTATEGNIRYNSASKKVEFRDDSDWVQLADASGDVTLQEAYVAGAPNTPAIALDDTYGDFSIVLDHGDSVGGAGSADVTITGNSDQNYLMTDVDNSKIIFGDNDGTNTVVQTDVGGGLAVTDALTGDGDYALYAATTVGDGISAGQSQSVIYSDMTTSGVPANAFAYAVQGRFGSDGTDNAEALLFGLGSIFTGLGGGSGTAGGVYVANNGSADDYVAHIVLNGGSQGTATAQRIAAFNDLVLTTFGGDLYLNPDNEIVYLADTQLYFQSDNTYDIGQSEDNRPKTVYVGTDVKIGGDSIGSDGLTLTATTVAAADALTITSGSSSDLNITSSAYLKMTAGVNSDIWEVVQDGRGTAWKINDGVEDILWVNTTTDDIGAIYPLEITYSLQTGEKILYGHGTTAADANAAHAVNGTLISGGLSGSQTIDAVVASVSGDVGDGANATLNAFTASTGGDGGGQGTLIGLNIGQNFDYDILMSDAQAEITATQALDLTAGLDMTIGMVNDTDNLHTMTIFAANPDPSIGTGTGDCKMVIEAKTELDINCTDGDIDLSPGSSGVVDVATALNLPQGTANARAGNIRYDTTGDGSIYYYDDTGTWVQLANATGSVTLQSAYNAGTTIALAQAKGDLAITLDDGPSAGAGIADFTIAGTGAESYFQTDAVNTRILLGDGANSITVDLPDDTLLRFGDSAEASVNYDEDGNNRLQFAGVDVELNSDLVFGASATYNIGSLANDATDGFRPDTIYTNNEVVVGSTVTIGSAAITSSGDLAITNNSGSSDLDITSRNVNLTVSDNSLTAFNVSDATGSIINIDSTNHTIAFCNSSDNHAVGFQGSGRVSFSGYLNLPTLTASPSTRDLRYDSTARSGDGGLEFYDETNAWVQVATSDSVTLQQAYENGNTITLDAAEGNLVVTLDATSVGGDFGDFLVQGPANEVYLLTQAADGYIALGDGVGGVVVGINDTLLAWATDAGGDIGTASDNRPDNIYAASSMAVSDGTTTVTLTETGVALTADTAGTEDLILSAANTGAGNQRVILRSAPADLILADGALSEGGLTSITLTPSGAADYTAGGALTLGAGAASTWTFLANDAAALTIKDSGANFLVLDTTTGAKQIEQEQFLRAHRGDDVQAGAGLGGGIKMTDGDSSLATGYVTYAANDGGTTKAYKADADASGMSVGAPDPANVFGVVTAKSGTVCQINTIHGMPVPVYFNGDIIGAHQNGKVVYLSVNPGCGTLTAPTDPGTDVWQLGILVGADGATDTPNVIWMPQFRYSNA